MECADGTVQRIYEIPDADKAKVWGEGNLLASPFFPQSGGILVDWVTLEKAEIKGTVVDVKVAPCLHL